MLTSQKILARARRNGFAELQGCFLQPDIPNAYLQEICEKCDLQVGDLLLMTWGGVDDWTALDDESIHSAYAGKCQSFRFDELPNDVTFVDTSENDAAGKSQVRFLRLGISEELLWAASAEATFALANLIVMLQGSGGSSGKGR